MPSLMRYVNIISRCGLLWRGEKLRGTGLKPGQAPYILTLCHTPGLSQEQIARRVYIDKSNVTRHLGALEREGFVERRQSEADRRVTLVYPTQKAYDIYPYVRQITREWNEYLTEDWTEEEIALLKSMLDRISSRAADYAQRDLADEPGEEAKGDKT
ncbi:MAG: MarR family transcriptional regulator [Clostridia bacterium]|nr:MarR family transcriptional regulator [Clostridia bacterium]